MQTVISRLMPLLPELTMPQQNYLEQALRDLNNKVDQMQKQLLEGQSGIRVEVAELKGAVRAIKNDLDTHTVWANAQAQKIEELANEQESGRLEWRLNIKRLDTWAWLLGIFFTVLGAVLAMAWQWFLHTAT